MSVKFLIQNARRNISFILLKICDNRGQGSSEPDRPNFDAYADTENSRKNKLSKADTRVAAVFVKLAEIIFCDFN